MPTPLPAPTVPETYESTLARADTVAHTLVRTLKSLHAARQSMPRAHPAVDPLSYPVLFALQDGPVRVSDVAAAVHQDLSITSRQASTLTQHGLVDKVPDPADGRAALLSLSAEGRDLLERMQRERAELFAHLLTDWSEEEVAVFAHGLDRLTRALTERPLPPTAQMSR